MRFEEFKLDELTGVKKYHNLTFHALLGKIAEEHGLKILGSGALGTVMQGQDPNTVYKVVEQDDAYLSFVNFAMKNPNPHFPVFEKMKLLHSFYKRFSIQPNTFTVVKMEKLTPLPWTTAEFLADMASARYLHQAPMFMPNGQDNTEEYTYNELSETRPWINSVWYAIQMIRHSKLVKGNEDFHVGNFMQRADGTIVIIDPVADPKAMAMTQQADTMARRGQEPEQTGPLYQKKKKKPVKRVKKVTQPIQNTETPPED